TIFNPSGVANNLNQPGDIAVVEQTGLVYVAGLRQINVYDNTNALVATIPLAVSPTPNYHRVNQTTAILYFRAGNNILVVDGRPLTQNGMPNPAFNTVAATLGIGGALRNFAI